MLNKIWFGLLAIGLLYGFGKSVFQDPRELAPPTAAPTATTTQPDDTAKTSSTDEATRAAAVSEMGKRLTNAAIDSAQTSVTICLQLIGMMALWLGIMKIAEDAGLVEMLARVLRPVLRWLFPGVPAGHPAGGAMVMNLAANILGLDNAATPLGLKAMKELQTLNPVKDTASNAMAMFLAINTSSITLIAFTVIAYRKAAGSIDPANVISAMTLATICSTVVAIIAVKSLQRFYPVEPPVATATGALGASAEQTGDADRASAGPATTNDAREREDG